MTQSLKIECIVTDLTLEGEVASFLVTKEQLTAGLSKKADLVDGKIQESNLPDFIANGFQTVNQKLSTLETSITDGIQSAKDYAEAYTDEKLIQKADLVDGKVPASQLPSISEYSGLSEALTSVLDQARRDMIERTDEIQRTKADIGEDGKVLREQLPNYVKIPGLETVIKDILDNKVNASDVYKKSETMNVEEIEATVERISPTRVEVEKSLMMSEVVRVHGFEQKYIDAGGYPYGAVLTLVDGVTEVVSVINNNKNNPNENVIGWKPHGIGKFITGMSYGLNAEVVLSNGDKVKSIVDGNTNDPNLDMTGWVEVNSASQIVDKSGKTQQEINNSKSIPYLLSVNRFDGLMIKTSSYHPDLSIGGNTYKYDTSISRLSHNGGTVIDPTKTFPSDWSDKTQQQSWFTATSDLMGVFVLVKPDTDLCASDFGAHPNKDSSHAIQTAVNYSAYRTVIYADVILNSSETLQIKNGCGLRGDHYTHNSRSTLKTSIFNYSGTSDAVRFGEFSDTAARNITLKDVHLFDVLGTARCAAIAYDLIGSDVDFVTTGFEVSLVAQHYLYYINRCKVFGYNYRKNGILIGGNINEGAVEFKLISTSLEIDTGFSCGQTSAAYGVLPSSSNNPTISGSVEQHSGRHFNFNLIRGGVIKPYFESPAVDGSAYQNIQMAINRCYGSEFIVYGSGKSGYSGYIDNSRDCKISGELKGGVTADLNITSTCFGINTSSLHAYKIIAANYSTGSIVGRAANGGSVRDSYGASSATPTSGCYGTGSKLWYTNPITLTPITVVTDVTLNTGVTPNTITKSTKTINQKEIGKLITVAGSFGNLATTTVTGNAGESVLVVNTGANNILVGDYLSIPTNSGSYRIDYIYQDGATTMIRVNRALTVSVSAVTASYFTPTTEPIITTF